MKHLRTITELDAHGCKWPVATDKNGTHLFCNEPQRDNSSYCTEHHAKAHIRKDAANDRR